jgi:hypothetical protein
MTPTVSTLSVTPVKGTRLRTGNSIGRVAIGDPVQPL